MYYNDIKLINDSCLPPLFVQCWWYENSVH